MMNLSSYASLIQVALEPNLLVSPSTIGNHCTDKIPFPQCGPSILHLGLGKLRVQFSPDDPALFHSTIPPEPVFPYWVG
jgi:hypothetical protein